ncbi:Zinc finger FYVE domain-containing protein 1 [Blattella germanica]|nr:Zinc finger FYVE domain-containing protein 1 [Blattella germanica]
MPILQMALLHVERRLGIVCQWAHNSFAGTDSDDEDFILTYENNSLGSLPPDVTLTTEFTSLKLGTRFDDNNGGSFLLLDGKENLKVSSAEQFMGRLNCDGSIRIKVVSVFGNTGDGKSHTLNQTFFGGDEVFRTSSEQDSCTLGVWAAFDPHLRVICLDTEGLLGSTSHENQRTRLLLKVLVIAVKSKKVK